MFTFTGFDLLNELLLRGNIDLGLADFFQKFTLAGDLSLKSLNLSLELGLAALGGGATAARTAGGQ